MGDFNRGYTWAKKARLNTSLKRTILKYEKKRGSAWDKGCAKAVREKGVVKPKRRSSRMGFNIGGYRF